MLEPFLRRDPCQADHWRHRDRVRSGGAACRRRREPQAAETHQIELKLKDSLAFIPWESLFGSFLPINKANSAKNACVIFFLRNVFKKQEIIHWVWFAHTEADDINVLQTPIYNSVNKCRFLDHLHPHVLPNSTCTCLFSLLNRKYFSLKSMIKFNFTKLVAANFVKTRPVLTNL